MKVEIEVSETNEGNNAPYWLILDPRRNNGYGISSLAAQITGPFFSREEAENHLKRFGYNYSKRAAVYCKSGCYSPQYVKKFDEEYHNYITAEVKEKGAEL